MSKQQSELEELVYELWSVVKHDSLASSRIGSPSGNTRTKIRELIDAEVEAQLAECTDMLPIINDAWCIACGHPTLYLGNGGLITCALDTCPDPSATYEAVKNLEQLSTTAQTKEEE